MVVSKLVKLFLWVNAALVGECNHFGIERETLKEWCRSLGDGFCRKRTAFWCAIAFDFLFSYLVLVLALALALALAMLGFA